MKKNKIFLFSLLSLFLFSACSIKNPLKPNNENEPQDQTQSGEDEEEISIYEKDEQGFYKLENNYFVHEEIDSNKFKFASKINKVKYANNYRLFFGDTQIPIYGCNSNPNRVWSPNPINLIEVGVGIIKLDRTASFTLQTNFAFKEQSTHILPSNSGISLEKDFARRTIKFTISKPGQYTISFLKNMAFHLFVNPIEEYKSEYNNSNKIVFSKGLHTKNNNPYINSSSFVNLSSNTTVVLELGAVVEAGFIANNASNVEIIGDGIVLGANFERDGERGTKLIPFEFNYCNRVAFKGISTLDPAGWCYNLYFDNNVLLDDIKIISSRSNGDGVSLQSCTNVECKNAFVRSWDDSLVVKNYPKWYNRNEHGTTKNIKFSKCQIWTDLAQCMELGYETVGTTFEDVYFEDIIVLYAYHKAVISIHNANNAYIKNIHFDNITIENARMGLGDGSPYLIDFANLHSSNWSDQHTITSLGFIEGVYVNNVTVLEGSSTCLIHLSGCKDSRSGFNNNEEHFVKNINLHNIKIYDRYLTQNDEKLRIDDFVYNLKITNN